MSTGIIFQEATRLYGQRPAGETAVFMFIQRCLCGIFGACTPGREKAKTTQTVADAPAPVDRGPGQQTGQKSPADQSSEDGGAIA